MGANVTNQQLGVVTTTSGHEAKTGGATDVCWDPARTKASPHPNQVASAKAAEHTSDKTKMQEGNVVCVGDAMTPSDPEHADKQGGVKSGTYRKEARAVSGSPNIRAEGKAPARTGDPTTQNHANTTGKLIETGKDKAVDDLRTQLNKSCSLVSAVIKCGHQKPVNLPTIEVLTGDTITVVARRINAREAGKPPVCREPEPRLDGFVASHTAWEVRRSGGMEGGKPLEEKEGHFAGDTLVLGGEWTGAGVSHEEEAGGGELSGRAVNAERDKLMNSSGLSGGAANKAILRQIKGSEKTAGALKQAAQAHALYVDFSEFLAIWQAWRHPVVLSIAGVACSGSAAYAVHCYPAGKASVELPLEKYQKIGDWFKKALTVTKTVGKLGSVDVDGRFECPGKGAKIGVDLKWLESAEDPYHVLRSAEFGLWGELLSAYLEFECPLANLLALMPALAFAAKGIDWAIKKLGADAGIGVRFGVNVKLGFAVDCEWNLKDGWKWSALAPKLPIELYFYIFARIILPKLGVEGVEALHIEGQAKVVADPTLIVEYANGKNGAGIAAGFDDFQVKIGFSMVIHVDVGLYHYDSDDTYWPDSLQCRVHKWTKQLMGN